MPRMPTQAPPPITDTGHRTAVQLLRVDAGAAGQRVDNFLLGQLKGAPRSLIYRILRSGEVRVNMGRVKPTHRLVAGDQVRVPPLRLAAEAAPATPPAGLLAALEQAILHEDNRLLVLDKPAGVAVHGGSGVSLGVIEALRVLRPGAELELVHRLDRDTSGCLVISKRGSALRQLHARFRDGQVTKRYLTLLTGPLPRPVTEVTAPLRKNLLQGGERMVRVDPVGGKPARTRLRALATATLEVAGAARTLTLAEVTLYTGRTHQIRVHAAHLGAPVAGDDKYGDAAANAALRPLGLQRLFLHAAGLTFQLGEDAPALTITAPLPAALQTVLTRLGCVHTGA